MANIKPKQTKIVMVFKERKLPGITRNDEFYKYVDLAHNKYFNKKSKYLPNFIDKTNLSAIQKNSLLRNILIISIANERGYLGVDWERFFAQPVKSLQRITDAAIDYIDKNHKSIIDEWDKAVEKTQNKQDKDFQK